jgi:glycosyltransferase involved in cell wall biosynthesis
MRTVQLTRRFVRDDWGGTETVVFETSRRLQEMGHHAEVLCTMATAKSTQEVMSGLSVRRYPYFYPYLGMSADTREILDKKGGSPFSFRLMRALKKVPELDLIHLHCANRIGGAGRTVARQRRIPYVISLHGGVFDVPKEESESLSGQLQTGFDWGKLIGWWVGSRYVMADAGAILCVGYPESVLAQKNLPDKRVIYLPNGADTKRFSIGDGPRFRAKYGIPKEARVLLTVARIDSQKNQALPVRLLPSLREIEPNTHLLLVGNVTNQKYYDDLLALVKSQGMESAVTIIPGIASDSPDLVDAYHAADVFVLPSIHEPFGIVILEAWSAGLPVLASRVGGIPHFVEDGRDALLFDVGDDSLVGAYRALVEDKSISERLGAAGQKKAQNEYDWDVITRRLLGIYDEVIRENPLRQ